MTKKDNKIVVYTYVVGDLFHLGHLRCLQQAKALGDRLIVGVLTDEATESYKRKPIVPFEERIQIIQALKVVNGVMRQENLDPTDNLKSIRADIVVHGDDWDENFPGAEYMRSIGKRAERVKWFPGRPTTEQIGFMKGYVRGLDENKTRTS